MEEGESYAQLVDPGVSCWMRPGRSAAGPCSTPAERRRAARETIFVDRARVPGLDEPSRILATEVERAGTPVVLVVGATSQDRTETLSSLRTELLVAVPVALVLATIAGYLLAGLSLRAVEAMRRRAAAISADTRGERLPVPATGDELERLGQTLNSMLARLEAAVERERDFVADAGHELRTPLALLRTELELALRHGETMDELRGAIQVSEEEIERLTQLAEDLLLIARTDQGELELRRERIEARVLLASVATRFEWRAAQAGREIIVDAPAGVQLTVDRLRVEQALGNLVDNALRHATGTVLLEAEPVPDATVALHVRDPWARLSGRVPSSRVRALHETRRRPCRSGHRTRPRDRPDDRAGPRRHGRRLERRGTRRRRMDRAPVPRRRRVEPRARGAGRTAGALGLPGSDLTARRFVQAIVKTRCHTIALWAGDRSTRRGTPHRS